MTSFPLVVLLSPLILTTRGSAESLESLRVEKCEYSVQQNIYNSLPQCLPRRTLVDLRQFFADDHDIIQVNKTSAQNKIKCPCRPYYYASLRTCKLYCKYTFCKRQM